MAKKKKNLELHQQIGAEKLAKAKEIQAVSRISHIA